MGRWITFYNHHGPHSAYGERLPAAIYFSTIGIDQQVQAVAQNNRNSVQA
jgi:putative transposase